MGQDAEISTATSPANGTSRYPVVNLVVDVGFNSESPMTDAERGYHEKLSARIDELRAQGIPTVWISMSNHSTLHAPEQNWPAAHPQPRDPEALARLDFTEHGPAGSKPFTDENRAFVEKFGPKDDEYIYPKAFFDAFTGVDDIQRLQPYLNGQRAAQYAIDIHKAIDGPQLKDLLKQWGTQEVLLEGGNADVCVMSTAMGAAMQGLKATVLTDLVVSRDDPAAQKGPGHHEALISSKLDKIINNPQALADDPTHSAFADPALLSADEKAKIGSNIRYGVSNAVIASLSHNTAPQTEGTATSRFMLPAASETPAAYTSKFIPAANTSVSPIPEKVEDAQSARRPAKTAAPGM